MYPVVYKGWLRLKIALAAFLAGSILFAVEAPVMVSSDWYGNVAVVLLFGGLLYLVFVGEWLRVCFKKRRDPETRGRILRLGAPLFFVGALSPAVLNLPYLVNEGGSMFSSISLIVTESMLVAGTAIMVVAIYRNCKSLPGKVELSAEKAFGMMKESGCSISEDPLWIGLDPRLKVAATTYPVEGGSVIIVSPSYVVTRWNGGLDNILVHEMAHIYRRETKHLLELTEIFTDLMERYMKSNGYSRNSFQIRTIIRTMSELNEMLTDNFTYRVLEKSKIDWANPMIDSLQKLVAERTSWDLRPGRKRWTNALLIMKNSIYTAQMQRHNLPDTGEKVKTANRKLLGSMPETASSAFDYFQRRALELIDDTDYQKLREMLEGFLEKLIELAEN